MKSWRFIHQVPSQYQTKANWMHFLKKSRRKIPQPMGFLLINITMKVDQWTWRSSGAHLNAHPTHSMVENGHANLDQSK